MASTTLYVTNCLSGWQLLVLPDVNAYMLRNLCVNPLHAGSLFSHWKPPVLCCSQEPEEQLQEEYLYFCDSILEITTAAALEQCQQAVNECALCCLALLVKEGQHYFSTLRPLSKSQITSMHKQVGEHLKYLTRTDKGHCMFMPARMFGLRIDYAGICSMLHTQT